MTNPERQEPASPASESTKESEDDRQKAVSTVIEEGRQAGKSSVEIAFQLMAKLSGLAFLAGAPPEDDGKDSLRAEVEFLREQQLGTEDDG